MNDLTNIIEAHGWVMSEQNFLDIKDTDYTLSVIPEYTYWTRNQYDMIVRSKTPTGLTLNMAICRNGDPEMFMNINSEEEFYDFMICFKKEFYNGVAA